MMTQERILLVDDDANLLQACWRNLRRHFRMETALGPEIGLRMIQEEGPFAVVVSDMQMPLMDGVQFLHQVKTISPDTIRMMLTGHPHLQTAIDAVNEGNIFRFLTKPCAPEILIAAIEAALEQRQLVRNRVELLETKLRHAQKMEVMGQCAAGAFHELRNILSIIDLRAHLTLTAHSANPKLAQSLSQIQAAAGTAANLMQRMANFSRREEQLQFAAVAVPPWLQQLVETLSYVLPKSIHVNCEAPEQLPPVRGDAGALSQVLLNLAFNARDAMPDGGELTLQVEAVDSGTTAAENGQTVANWLCLTVTDTGCGMEPATQERLFETFFTTKKPGEGTGLGLSMAARIIQQHQGRIEVSSQPGEGATFKIYLPVWEAAQVPLTPKFNDECQEANSLCG